MSVFVRPTLLDPSKYVWIDNDSEIPENIYYRLANKVGEFHVDIVYLVCLDKDNGGFKVSVWDTKWVTILDNTTSVPEALHYAETYELTVGSPKIMYNMIEALRESMNVTSTEPMFL